MKTSINDIIDLEYFIGLDEDLDSSEEIQSKAIRDRNIFRQCKNTERTEKTLLLAWLAIRKEEFLNEKGHTVPCVLPGTIFSTLYSWMIWIMALSGGLTGVSMAYSFLAYHGNHPINVTVFMALFVVLQVVLILFTLIFLLRKGMGTKKGQKQYTNAVIQPLVFALLFKVLPRVLNKAGWTGFKKNMDQLTYTACFVRMKSREYQAVLYWPVFILTAVFSFCFSAGALAGTFFRVVVSDMAFGWQSTLMTSSSRVYDLVSFLSVPWSWLVPKTIAHPSLEQIEGSRILLKEGLEVLATQDLISWWPFICMAILVYAVIPRGLLIVTGVLAQKHVLELFDFTRPGFRQLIARMQSPVLGIDSHKQDTHPAMGKPLTRGVKDPIVSNPRADGTGQAAVLIASKRVYSDEIMNKVIQGIETRLFFNVTETINIFFDIKKDANAIDTLNTSDADQVVLVYEVWQPPIRGLLYYITQIKAAMNEKKTLWIVLTQEVGQENFTVDPADIQYEVWKKAVFKLEIPDIIVKRFVQT